MDDPRYSIGELSRRTGLTVKTIRFYSDRGILAPSGRTASGHRRYGVDALARLELVRTLRELGLDLATIRKVVESEATLPDVAEAHLRALEAQIHVLRLRHAVLKAVTRRGTTPEEITLMHDLAKLTEEERRRLIDDFLDAVFGGLEHPGFAGIARSMTPELPESPAVEQVDAWVELAGLARDPDFRALMRRLAEGYDAAPRRDLPWLDIADDPRRERYLELLAVINGWAAPDHRRVP